MAHTRTFCCCLPVRLGVFVLTILNLAGGVSFAVLGWAQVTHLKNTPLATVDEIALILHSVIFTILAVSSLLGFIGAITKHRSLVSVFSSMLLTFLCISIATGIYVMYSVFRDQGRVLVQACLSDASNFSEQTCQVSASITQVLIVAVYITMWLLQLWGFLITRSYCHQLDDEEEEGLKPAMVGKPVAPRDNWLPNRSAV